MKFANDAWLSAIFGYDVFKLDVPADESVHAADVFAAVPGGLPQRAFYYVKLPVSRVAQVGALTSAGFHVVDVNVTFERLPGNAGSNPQIAVRDAQPGDESAVLEIACSSFVYSRFHLDPLFSKELADKVKREWVANYLRGQRGDRLLVAEMAGRPVGFLALLQADSGKTGVIDLIGVDTNWQGRGIGKQLVNFHVHEAMNKYSRLLVGTQVANVPSMRLYSKCGYMITNSSYVLHAHVNEGRLII